MELLKSSSEHYYYTEGQGDPIVFLHGFPELSYSFRYLMTDLASKGMYCIAPDQRGYGKTTYLSAKEKYLSEFSVLNLAKDIFSLLESLNIKKINIVGHDFGSYVSCYFSLLYPDMVNSLVIMSMPFGGPPSKNTLGNFNINSVNKSLLKLEEQVRELKGDTRMHKKGGMVKGFSPIARPQKFKGVF